MKNILVTGSNGQLGSEMRRLGTVSPNNYIFTDVNELDITNKAAVTEFVSTNKIDIMSTAQHIPMLTKLKTSHW